MPQFPRSIAPHLYEHVKTLHALRHDVGRDSPKGQRARITFATITIRYGLFKALDAYELWDAGFEGLGPRQFDTCFEMGDSGEVGAGIVKDARANGYVDTVVSHFSENVWARWAAINDAQGCFEF